MNIGYIFKRLKKIFLKIRAELLLVEYVKDKDKEKVLVRVHVNEK